MAINSIANSGWLFNTPGVNKQQDSIAKLWNNYTSSQKNATSALAGLQEVNANLKSLMASYDEAKTTFNSELKENLDMLGQSAEKIKNYNFSVEKEGAISTTTETDDDGNVTETTTYSKDLQDALDTVKGFVSDYNTAIKFFKDNGSLSKRVENLAGIFGDSTYRASNYAQIGLNVGSDGSFTIDEAKLADAIINDPNKVARTLGKDGLAGKATEHVSFANSQAENLFPTAQAMFGDQIDAASLYTGKAYRNMTAYSNMGNLLNMMF